MARLGSKNKTARIQNKNTLQKQKTSTLKASEIKTSKAYQKRIPRQTAEERDRMKVNIQKHGIEKPLEISMLTGLLVDGHERFVVGQMAGIEQFPVTYKNFSSKLNELQYIINNNLCRRNLSTWWVGKLNHDNVELQRKLAKGRQRLGGKMQDSADERQDTSVQICTKVRGRSTGIAAKGTGISPRTQDTVEQIIKHGDKEIISQLDRGVITPHKAEKAIRQKEIESKPIPPLPAGKFNQIVEDPGWSFMNKNIGGAGKSGSSQKFRTQPTLDIAKIPVKSIVADDAILYMWTTNQHLATGSMLMKDFLEIAYGQSPEETEPLGRIKVESDALSVMICHGFTPKHIITWEKEKKEGWGGYGFNNVTEQLLIGVRGNVKAFGLQDKTIIKSKWDKNSHSKKPEVAWQLIEKCVKTQRWKHRKLEMNCRSPRTGWHPHGDEVNF